jgi:hypothetical protein
MILIPLSIEKCIFACWFGATHPIWPPVLPLNLTYILMAFSQLSWASLPYTHFLHSTYLTNLMSIFLSLGRLSRESKFEALFWHFVTILFFLRWEVVGHTHNPQAGVPPLVGCSRLLIQCIHRHPPHLEAVSSIRNLRKRHAVVTRDQLNNEMGFNIPTNVIWIIFNILRTIHTTAVRNIDLYLNLL